MIDAKVGEGTRKHHAKATGHRRRVTRMIENQSGSRATELISVLRCTPHHYGAKGVESETAAPEFALTLAHAIDVDVERAFWRRGAGGGLRSVAVRRCVVTNGLAPHPGMNVRVRNDPRGRSFTHRSKQSQRD